MAGNWPPISLKPFVDKDYIMEGNLAKATNFQNIDNNIIKKQMY